MPTDRVQRQIDRLLDHAEQAIAASDWALVRARCDQVLRLDPDNTAAHAYLAAADRGPAPPVAAAPDAAVAPPVLAPAPLPAPGESVPATFAAGRYTVRRPLGEGGKKRVYLAHDTRLDREVALALLKTDGLDPDGRERLRREARALGRLGDHPHVVTVFDTGEEAGQPFLVSRYMAGGSLADRLAAHPDHRLPLADVVRLGGQVCEGLAHAHRLGIVHRDLKPGNIWLAEDGSACVGDFGLAVAEGRTRLTAEGLLVGTAAYLAPEQALGHPPAPAADLYSLGCVLYELLTGHPPFAGDDAVAVITQQLHTAPIAPTWTRPDCPPALASLVLRLLEKDPGRRPATAETVATAFAAIALPPAGSSRAASAPPGGAGAAASELSTPAGPDPLYRTTFVGREAELRQVRAAFDGAMGGQGALVLVVGEPGIGKTALCEQLATYVALRGGRTLRGHCYEEGALSLPYLPIVEALRAYVLDRPPAALRTELGTGAPYVARIVSEVRERVGVELPPPADPEDDRWRLLEAVSGLLRRAAAAQPLVLVLEDLHWADRGTLDLLLHLARDLSGARLLVAATYRDVEVDRAHPLAGTLADLRRVTTPTRVALRGLGTAEVQAMLATIAGREVPFPLAEQVQRQTEGNPLFVQEVVRYLVEEGVLRRDAAGRLGRAGTSDTPLAMSIPEGLRDVIGKRMSRLSATCNRVLAVAAVCGREFRLDVLQDVAGVPEEAVEAAIEEAARAGVLEERRQPGALGYRFAHAFFRQTLYEELFTPRRIRLHQHVARALEHRYATRLADHAAELADHFAQSTDPADLAKAVHYGELAARRAMAVYAYSEAVRLLEAALQAQEVLDPDDQATRCDLLLVLGEALMPAGEPLRAAEVVAEAALRLADALGDQPRAVQACRLALEGLTRYGSVTINYSPQYRTWAERLGARAAPDSLDQVWADHARAGLLLGEGRWSESWALRLRALDLARRLGDRALLFWAASHVLGIAPPPGTMDLRRALAEEVVTWPREGVSARQVGVVLHRCGLEFLTTGQRARAEALWREGAELAAHTGDANLRLLPLFHAAQLATLDGDLVGAVAAADRLIARGEELGSPVYGAQLGLWAAFPPLLSLGRVEEMLTRRDAFLRTAGLPESSFHALVALRPLGLARLGRHEEAHRLLEAALAAGMDGAYSVTQVMLLETALVLEERGPVAALAGRLAPDAPLVLALFLTVVARHLGAAAALLGDAGPARAYFQQALEVAGQVRFRPEIALTNLQLAELLLAHYPADQAEALARLAAAIPDFQDMQMTPALERALALRARVLPDSAPPAASTSPANPSAVRALVTVLFTDIAGSTERMVALGDRAWRRLKARHHAVVRAELERFGGREVDTAGDGFFAVFPEPEKAVRCAQAIGTGVRDLGLEVRAGLHTGEVELQDEGVSGLTVHIGARVGALAGPGEVLVTQTVRDLVRGGGLGFEERGVHTLRGVPGAWGVFVVTAPG